MAILSSELGLQRTHEEITDIRKLAARPPNGGWEYRLSKGHLTGVLDRMPIDFKLQYPEDFDSFLSLALLGNPRIERMYIILDSAPMLWLKEKQPAECAKTLIKLTSGLHITELAEMGEYLFSGPFAKNLANTHPQIYGRFLTEILAIMPDDVAKTFATASLVDKDLGLYVIIPANELQLSPVALLVQETGRSHIKPIDEDFMRSLPATARKALGEVFSAEAREAANRQHMTTAHQLNGFVDTLKLNHG